jgi:hypothetical protein
MNGYNREGTMSRYAFQGNEPHYTILLGWDRPLETFYAQVWDNRTSSVHPVLWAGYERSHVTSVPALAEMLRPYGDIPADIRLCLEVDLVQHLTRSGTTSRRPHEK